MLAAGWANTASCRGDGSIVVGGYWSSAISADGGASWSRFAAPSPYPGIDALLAGIATAPNGATVVGGYLDYVGRAQAGATSTMGIAHPAAAEWWNGVAAAGGRFWAVGDGGMIMMSMDDGKTWSAQASATPENLYAVSFADALHGAAVGRTGTVVVTIDGGAHWTPRPLGIDRYVGAVYVDGTTIWVAGEGGFVASSPIATP
jgi:photosystem II stability/assembly factor-like uncharacterized protein